MSNQPVRKHVSTAEKSIGGMIMLLLVGIGFGVYLKGKHYDPSLYTVDEASLSSSSNAGSDLRGTIKETPILASPSENDESEMFDGDYGESYDEYESAAPGNGNAEQESVLNHLTNFEGFETMGDLERYSPDTLYEKINGRAPAYIGFNFQELTCRTFSIPTAAGQYLDVFIYRMDTPVNAFGIFSMERESGSESVTFVSQGYRSEMGFFFRQGANYIQVIASDISPDVLAAAERFSETLADLIPIEDSGVGAAALLPSEHQIPGSTSYIQEYAYGLELLNDVFEARYQIDEVEFPYFGMQSDPDSLAQAFEGVKAYFSDYGTIIETYNIAEASVLVGETFGQYSIIFLTSDSLGGVMNADDLDTPQTFVESQLSP